MKHYQATPWLLLTIIGVAFLLRISNLAGQNLWRDEVDTIIFANWPPGQLIASLLEKGHNGPLFFILMRPWLAFTNHSEFALRYPAALLGTLVIPLGFVLARQMIGCRRVAVIFSLLLATSPYLIWYSQEAKMYAALIVLVGLSFWAYHRALLGSSPQGRWWGLFVVATSLSFYLHILAPLMLPVYLVIAGFYQRQLRARWPAWLISLACLTLPYLPLVWWQASLVYLGMETGHPFYPLTDQLSILMQVYSGGLLRLESPLVLTVFLFLFLCGLTLPAPRQPLKPRFILLSWLVIPTLLIYLISWRAPVFEDRYLIYLSLPFYLLVANGVLLLRQYSSRLAGLCLGLLLIYNLLAVWHHQRQPIKADFRAATAYMQAHPFPPQTVMIQTPYLQRTLNYYYPVDQYTLLEGLWTNDDKDPAIVDLEMRNLLKCLTDVWLVVSEEALWDERGLVRQWLNDNAQLVDEAHFSRVSVYFYRFRPRPSPSRSLEEGAFRLYLPVIQGGCLVGLH